MYYHQPKITDISMLNSSLSDKEVILTSDISSTGQIFTFDKNANIFKKLKIECSVGGVLHQNMYVDCNELPCVVSGGNQGYFGLCYFIDATWKYYFSFDITDTTITIKDYSSAWGAISIKVTGYNVL